MRILKGVGHFFLFIFALSIGLIVMAVCRGIFEEENEI